MAGHVLEPGAQQHHPLPSQPAVGLKLGLTRAAGADPAAEPLEMLPHAPHPLQVVLQLGQLDLELALRGVRMLGEDVEDHRGAVDHAHLQPVLEMALLTGSELVVAHDHLGADAVGVLLQLVQLAAAQIGRGVGTGTALHHRADRLHPGGSQQLAHLVEMGVAGLRRGHRRDHHRTLGSVLAAMVDRICHRASIESGQLTRRCCSIRPTASRKRSSGSVSDNRT